MKRIKNYSSLLALMLLLCCVSCSEDNLEPVAEKDGMFTVTFNIAGIDDGSLATRAGEYGDQYADYTTKLYIFSKRKNNVEDDPTSEEVQSQDNPFADYTFLRSEDVEAARITLSLESDYNYLFAFIACEDDYWKKDDNPVLYSGGSLTTPSPVKENNEFINCFIQVVNEDEASTSFPVYPKAANARDYFMVYGAGLALPGFDESAYIPETIVLKRQMGAVTFKVPEDLEINSDVNCNVLTDYYRLYLSQILESNQSGTRNHANDYTSSTGYYPVISCQFPTGLEDIANEFTFYLPCTTTRNEIDANHQNEQTYYLQEDYWYELVGNTSIEWDNGNTKYETTQPFPIFPNRRTILTVNKEGNIEYVHFTNIDEKDKDHIDVEDDWNGIN